MAMTEEQLAAIKPGEGSYALQDATDAARRRIKARRTPVQPIDMVAVDKLAADTHAKDAAAFEAIVQAINAAPDHGSMAARRMRLVAINAMRQTFPRHAETEAA